MDGERELRAIVEERATAVAARDTAALLARLHPDVVEFNVLPPLTTSGSAPVEQAIRAWFDGYASDIGYEVRDLVVVADGDVGFCWFVYHVTGTLTSGAEVDMWVRATLGCRRVDGRWVIVHDHESVPFNLAP